jgi:hypothetical protein
MLKQKPASFGGSLLDHWYGVPPRRAEGGTTSRPRAYESPVLPMSLLRHGAAYLKSLSLPSLH